MFVQRIITKDYDEMSRRAADFVADKLRQNPELRLGLPTGNTPRGMYEQLVERYARGELDFSRVHTFNLDEYWGLEPDHPAAFARYIQNHFLRHVNVPSGQAHWPAGKGDAAENARTYEARIGAEGLDIIILGIGVNGHIGFNEPGAAFDARTGFVQLAERTRQDAFHPRSGFATREDVPIHGITMGIGTILEAKSILLLASGASKAEAIQRALEGPVTEEVPASALQRHGDVTVIVDEAAAARLADK